MSILRLELTILSTELDWLTKILDSQICIAGLVLIKIGVRVSRERYNEKITELVLSERGAQ